MPILDASRRRAGAVGTFPPPKSLFRIGQVPAEGPEVVAAEGELFDGLLVFRKQPDGGQDALIHRNEPSAEGENYVVELWDWE